MKLISTVIVFAIAAGGCATQQVRRDTARVVGAHTAQVQRDLAFFADARTHANATRHRTLNRLLENALVTEASNDRQVRVWTVAKDEERLSMHRELMAAIAAARERAAAAETTRTASAALVAASGSRIALRGEQLTATAKALARLAEKEKARDELKFIVAFFQEIDASRQEVLANAIRAANDASSTATSIARTATKDEEKP